MTYLVINYFWFLLFAEPMQTYSNIFYKQFVLIYFFSWLMSNPQLKFFSCHTRKSTTYFDQISSNCTKKSAIWGKLTKISCGFLRMGRDQLQFFLFPKFGSNLYIAWSQCWCVPTLSINSLWCHPVFLQYHVSNESVEGFSSSFSFA